MKHVANKVRIPGALAALWVAVNVIAGDATAALLRSATGTSGRVGAEPGVEGSGKDMVELVNSLLGQALIITVIIAPLCMAWGAGTMMFSTRGSGAQILGASVVAVVLVAAAKGIAA